MARIVPIFSSRPVQEAPLGTFLQDIKYAWRMLANSPGFAAVAILTLALGIGANTAIFSVVNTVLLRPLPFSDSQRLVKVSEKLAGFEHSVPMNAPDFTAFRERQHSFSLMAVYSTKHFDLSGEGEPERVEGARASATVFPLLGIQPVLGRAYTEEEDHPGHAALVLSYGLWMRRFGGDPSVLGRSVSLDRLPYTVIGVMPKGFQFPLKGEGWDGEPADLWVPMAFTPYELQAWGNMYNHNVLGRLKPGVTLAQAQSDAAATIAEVEKLYPPQVLAFSPGQRVGIEALPYAEAVTGNVRTPLLVLLAAVGVVLLIACANVANLLLARATGRQKEVAIRAALGAGRGRLVRQMLSESLLLGLASGAAAVFLGYWGIGALLALAPPDLPRMQEVHMDARVLTFALLLSVITALLFGLVPALEATHVDPHESLKEGGRSMSPSRSRRRLQSALIVLQTALAVVLLISAGLLVRSFGRLLQTDPGFRPQHVLTMTVSLPLQAYSHASDIRGTYQELLRKTRALPGVSSVGFSTDLPLNAEEHDAVAIDGLESSQNTLPSITQSWIMGDYFDAMGITLERGRMFRPDERIGSPQVVIVSEAAARAFWPNQDPIGKRMRFMGESSTVVGIARDVKDSSMQNPAGPHTYTPYLQEVDKTLEMPTMSELRTLHIAVRTQADPAAMISAVRGTIASLDPQLAVADIQTMEASIQQSLAPQRFNLFLLGLFAAVAVFLAAIGVYGVLSYSVMQRTREIGVRVALGAQRSNLLAMTLREGMRLTVLGAAFGVGAAFVLTRLMTTLLYGVTAHDPLTFIGVILLMCLVSAAACYIPARRAINVDPIVALRYE
jgi:putative ABC transport system permease protein